MLLAVIYILVPFGILSLGSIHRGHQYFLTIASVILIAGLIKEKPVKWFFYYVSVYCIAIRLMNVVGIISANRANMALGSIMWLMVAAGLYVAVSLSTIKQSVIFNAICISAIIQSLIGITQYFFGIDPFLLILKLGVNVEQALSVKTVTGTLGNPNFFGGYIASSLPFFDRGKWRIGILLILFHLFVTLDSTGPVFAALIGIIIYYPKAKYIIGAFVIGLAFTIWGESGRTSTLFDSPRWGWWMSVLKKITQDWYTVIFGYGPGARTGYKFPIHSDWLELWFRYGVGMLALGIYYVISMRKQDKILFTALVITSVNCLASYGARLAPSAFLLIIIMGLSERSRHGRLSNIQRSSDRNQTGN